MPNKNKNVIVEQLDKEYVLFDAEKNTLYILNQTAYELWTRCDNESIDVIVSEFMKALDHDSIESIGPATIQEECENMLADFLEKGLIN